VYCVRYVVFIYENKYQAPLKLTSAKREVTPANLVHYELLPMHWLRNQLTAWPVYSY